MFSRNAVRMWVFAVLGFFIYEALAPLADGYAQKVLSLLATLLYVAVACYTIGDGLPARKPKDDRPSAVRARLEAAQRRRMND